MDRRNSDSEYFNLYTPIRNALRKYNPQSVLLSCIDYLYSPTKSEIDQLRKQPWTVLLVLKWAFLDEQSSMPGRPDIPRPKLMENLQRALELADKTRMPTDYEHVSLFLRTIAFQQFLYQGSPSFNGLARQKILFEDVPENHFFRTRFIQETGVSIDNFLRLSLALITPFSADERCCAIEAHWFSTLHKTYSPETIKAFLTMLSVPIDQLGKVLRQGDKVGRKISEYSEQTPFLSFPFVKINERYFAVSFKILMRSTEHFVYDLLKRSDVTAFNRAFGSRFESYVGRLLATTGLPIANEALLEKILPDSGKLIDFLLVEGDANILIDAKGVEMAARGKVAHLRDVVLGATKTSLVKAVEQAHDVNIRLSTLGDRHPLIKKRNTTYLIVVTYKELYIGNGRVLVDSIGEGAVEAIVERCPVHARIPTDNMYFLTINELEHFVGLIKDKVTGVTEALERAKAKDIEPHTRKFIFGQHLTEWRKPDAKPSASELSSAQDELFADVESILRK